MGVVFSRALVILISSVLVKFFSVGVAIVKYSQIILGRFVICFRIKPCRECSDQLTRENPYPFLTPKYLDSKLFSIRRFYNFIKFLFEYLSEFDF